MQGSKAQSAIELLIITVVFLSFLIGIIAVSQKSLDYSNDKLENDRSVSLAESVLSAAELVYSQGVGSTRTIYVIIPDTTEGIEIGGSNGRTVAIHLQNGNSIIRTASFDIAGYFDPLLNAQGQVITGPQYLTLRAVENGVRVDVTSDLPTPELLPTPCGRAWDELGDCAKAASCSGEQECMNVTDNDGTTIQCACQSPPITCGEAWSEFQDCSVGTGCLQDYHCSEVLDGGGTPIGCTCKPDCSIVWGLTGDCGDGVCADGHPSSCEEVIVQGEVVDCTCKVDCGIAATEYGDCSKGKACPGQECLPPENWVPGMLLDSCGCREPKCDEVFDIRGDCSGTCPDVLPGDPAQNICWPTYNAGQIVSCSCEKQVPCDQAWLQFAAGLPSPAAACEMGYCNAPGEFCFYQNFPIESCYCGP